MIGQELSRQEFTDKVNQFENYFGSVSSTFNDSLNEDIGIEPLEFEVTPHTFHILFLAHLKLERDLNEIENSDLLSRKVIETIRDYFWHRLHPNHFDKYSIHQHFTKQKINQMTTHCVFSLLYKLTGVCWTIRKLKKYIQNHRLPTMKSKSVTNKKMYMIMFEVSIKVIEHILHRSNLSLSHTTFITGHQQLLVCEENHFVLYSRIGNMWTRNDSDKTFSNVDLTIVSYSHVMFSITSTESRIFKSNIGDFVWYGSMVRKSARLQNNRKRKRRERYVEYMVIKFFL